MLASDHSAAQGQQRAANPQRRRRAGLQAECAERIENRLRTSDAFSEDLCIDDMVDGSAFGEFMVRLKISGSDIPLVFMFYYDGLEVVNGLGQARTTHELACFYWALLNVRPTNRVNHQQVT